MIRPMTLAKFGVFSRLGCRCALTTKGYAPGLCQHCGGEVDVVRPNFMDADRPIARTRKEKRAWLHRAKRA